MLQRPIKCMKPASHTLAMIIELKWNQSAESAIEWIKDCNNPDEFEGYNCASIEKSPTVQYHINWLTICEKERNILVGGLRYGRYS